MKKKNIPYPGLTRKDALKLLKESKVVSTFVNDAYVAQHESMLREIEDQHRRNAEKLAHDNTIIGSGLIRVRKK